LTTKTFNVTKLNNKIKCYQRAFSHLLIFNVLKSKTGNRSETAFLYIYISQY